MFEVKSRLSATVIGSQTLPETSNPAENCAKMSIEDLAGKWELDTQGDPDTFMAAIGMGWLKRKAIGVALTLGFGR